jgi:hypothetical protein
LSNIFKNKSWRDRQLDGFNHASKNVILEQEKVMLDFVTKFSGIKWRWLGNNDNFHKICNDIIVLDDKNYQGVIFFSGKKMFGKTTSELVDMIRATIHDVTFAYVGINRYEITKHDIDLALPDGIEQSLDAIMNYCDPRFKRLHSFEHVDGNHMVGAHPRDCYGLCK